MNSKESYINPLKQESNFICDCGAIFHSARGLKNHWYDEWGNNLPVHRKEYELYVPKFRIMRDEWNKGFLRIQLYWGDKKCAAVTDLQNLERILNDLINEFMKEPFVKKK